LGSIRGITLYFVFYGGSINDTNPAPKRKFAESGTMPQEMVLDDSTAATNAFFTNPNLVPTEGQPSLSSSGFFSNQLMFPL
jgi:hypothetical protein